MSVIQALILSKEYFNKEQAERWVSRHKFKPVKKIHETPLTYRFRLKEPDESYDYRTKVLTTGVKAIIGYKDYHMFE